jgi:hypothetical protein
MRSKIATFFVLIFLLFSFGLCTAQTKKDQTHVYTEDSSVLFLTTFPGSRLIKYTADSITRKSRKEPYLKNLSELMELPDIRNQSKGVAIRIWFWASKRRYVLTISDNTLRKECRIDQFNIEPLPDSTDYIVMHKPKHIKQPTSGWKIFFTTIEKYQIADFPTGKTRRELDQSLTTMAYVNFEIVKNGEYRYYEYLEPSFYRTIDKNSKTIDTFLKFLNNELNFQLYKPVKMVATKIKD